MSDIKRRILKFAAHEGLSKNALARTLRMSDSSFRSKALEKAINSSALEMLLNKYPEINPEWLLTGTGYMLRAVPEQEYENKVSDLTTKFAPQESSDKEDYVGLLSETKAAYKRLAEAEREIGRLQAQLNKTAKTKAKLRKVKAKLAKAEAERAQLQQKHSTGEKKKMD